MSTDLAGEVAALEWYHTLELPGGVVTKGFFDHRSVLNKYGFPASMAGTRALDVGTFDGFFSFEMERRGAEVVALDVPDTESLDWPVPSRLEGTTRFQPRHRNFDVAREALESTVQRRFHSAYKVTREDIGTFDRVFIGSVLIHLRDPVGALMNLYELLEPGGVIHISEEVHRWLDLFGRGRPLAKFQAISPHLTWWIGNRACWEHMLRAAGFLDVRHGATFVIPFNGGKGGVRHGVLTARRPL
ncbi:MAG: class I SAM-dependent methyltransferase [Actinomycetota bacterium]